jgi:hypothetical protein
LFELAPGRIVDSLEAGVGEFQLGLFEGAGEALVLPGQPLGVDEQAEALVEGETRHLGVLLLLAPRVGHGVELEVLQLL